MKSLITFLLFTLFFSIHIFSQEEMEELVEMPEELPYYEIPDAPKDFSAEGVTARMIDGLGYRYFWATEDLREEDLSYKAGETSRTTAETIEHLYGLSKTTLNAIASRPNIRGGDVKKEELDFAEKRKRTLENFKAASDFLRKKNAQVEDMKIVFQRGEKKSEYPFWNLINGPIADALWHSGQIVANRRSSGNPLHPGVNVFRGKTKF